MPEGYPTWAVVVGVIGAVGGLSGVAALINSLSSAKSERVDQLCKIIDAQSRRITTLEADLASVRAELAEWKARYYQLADWVRGVGLEPFEGSE